jgi:hypothetical protein
VSVGTSGSRSANSGVDRAVARSGTSVSSACTNESELARSTVADFDQTVSRPIRSSRTGEGRYASSRSIRIGRMKRSRLLVGFATITIQRLVLPIRDLHRQCIALWRFTTTRGVNSSTGPI